MEKEKLIDFFVEKVGKGEMPFDHVRKNLVERGLSEGDIKEMVKTIDNLVQADLLTRNNRSILDQMILLGVITTLIGFVLTIGSFAGLFSSTSAYVIVIAYGPLFGGLAIIFAGLRRKRRKNLVDAKPKKILKRTWQMKN